MSESRDRYPSYLNDSLNHVHHYINYRGRTFDDLIALQKELDELTRSINNKLMMNFKPETMQYLEPKQ